MAPKRKAASASEPKGKTPAAAAKVDGKRKAPAVAPVREVRRKVSIAEAEELKFVSHPSHGKIPGEVFVFGDGDCGQLGLGEDITERLRPFPVNVDGQRVLQVACGGMHTVVLTEDHHVYSWGVNDEGALGRRTAGELWEKSGRGSGEPGDPYTPGRVTFSGDGSDPDYTAPLHFGKVVQISAGDSHTCALMASGEVWAWGTYRDGSGVMGFSAHTRIQLTPELVYKPATAEQQVVRLASGADHAAGVTAGGALVTWGSGQQGQLGRVGPRLSDRVKMETLLTPHAVPIKRARGVKSTKVVDVNCGTYATFALTADGSVYACGLNNYGQLALPGQQALFYSPTLLRALTEHDVLAVRSGQHHTLAATKGGELLAFGRPTYGRLGRRDANVGADVACPEVRRVEGLAGVKVAGAAAGLAVSGCFSEEGDAWMWGFGTSNQLGKGDDDADEVVPRKLAETKKFSGKKVVALELGGQHVAMLCVPKPGAEAGTAQAQ